MSTEMLIEKIQYLTFKLGAEEFAVDVSQVREVVEFPSITKVPRTPEFMRGVINLRGSVVPVMDLRLNFGMSKTEKTLDTCIVVLEVPLENETMVLGALTDAVQEVIELAPGQIEAVPQIGKNLRTGFLHGIGKRNDNFILILDLEKIFTSDELALIKETEEEM